MMQIREIILTEHKTQIYPLLILHREELATNKILMVLDPDWERYELMERAGIVLTLGLFNGDKIVGYSVTIITPNMHYKGMVQGYGDVIFIHPAYRKGSWGVKLIKQTMEQSKKRGAVIYFFHVKANTTASKLLRRMGFALQDEILGKEL